MLFMIASAISSSSFKLYAKASFYFTRSSENKALFSLISSSYFASYPTFHIIIYLKKTAVLMDDPFYSRKLVYLLQGLLACCKYITGFIKIFSSYYLHSSIRQRCSPLRTSFTTLSLKFLRYESNRRLSVTRDISHRTLPENRVFCHMPRPRHDASCFLLLYHLFIEVFHDIKVIEDNL